MPKTRVSPTPVESALVALFRATDRVKSFVAETIEPHGITLQQYNVLRILRGAEPAGLPTLTIAGRMIEKAPGITRMIDRLEARGLVERERRLADRRCVHCRVTARGLELLKRLDRPVLETDTDALSSLTRDELARLVELLDRIAPNGRAGPEERCDD